jgi:hypothetical protein
MSAARNKIASSPNVQISYQRLQTLTGIIASGPRERTVKTKRWRDRVWPHSGSMFLTKLSLRTNAKNSCNLLS